MTCHTQPNENANGVTDMDTDEKIIQIRKMLEHKKLLIKCGCYEEADKVQAEIEILAADLGWTR